MTNEKGLDQKTYLNVFEFYILKTQLFVREYKI